MKRFAFLLLLTGWLVPVAAAQETEHVQAGIFADYLRVGQTDANFAGLGARLGIVAYRNLKLEGEMGYEFDQAFTERFTDSTTGTVTVTRSGMRIIHGEFGPKVNLGLERWNIHPFLTLKGGFIDFRINHEPATIGTFFSSVDTLRRKNVNGVLYPGGGLEGHLGPIGVRLDVGDEIYFNHGTNHNLRVAFGPYIRF
jgi:hypothetical protein